MRIKPRDVPAPPITPTPREVADAQVNAFREQWRAARRAAQALANEAQVYLDHGVERRYKEAFAATYREVNLLVGMATRLTPLAREAVEAGVGPLFLGDGALAPWWAELWLRDPRVVEVARVRRMKARV